MLRDEVPAFERRHSVNRRQPSFFWSDRIRHWFTPTYSCRCITPGTHVQRTGLVADRTPVNTRGRVDACEIVQRARMRAARNYPACNPEQLRRPNTPATRVAVSSAPLTTPSIHPLHSGRKSPQLRGSLPTKPPLINTLAAYRRPGIVAAMSSASLDQISGTLPGPNLSAPLATRLFLVARM